MNEKQRKLLKQRRQELEKKNSLQFILVLFLGFLCLVSMPTIVLPIFFFVIILFIDNGRKQNKKEMDDIDYRLA